MIIPYKMLSYRRETVAVLDRGRGGLGPPSFLPGPPTIRGAIPESVVAGSAN